MGKVIVKVKFTNSTDSDNAQQGLITESAIRTIETEGIVDTGAVMLSLPQDLVEKLGLRTIGQRRVRYANGQPDQKPIAGAILIEIQGRQALVDCLVQDEDSPVLIGQVPLELMDWAVHPQEQRLIPGHEGENEMALIEMYSYKTMIKNKKSKRQAFEEKLKKKRNRSFK